MTLTSLSNNLSWECRPGHPALTAGSLNGRTSRSALPLSLLFLSPLPTSGILEALKINAAYHWCTKRAQFSFTLRKMAGPPVREGSH